MKTEINVEAEREWPVLPQSFNDWWNANRLSTNNPFENGTPAYWAWEGWVACQQTSQPSKIDNNSN